jgi:dihydrofolate reductase
MPGRIVIDLFITLDGVAQAPGGPEEDTSDGLRYGGWQAPVSDDVVGNAVWEGLGDLDALLLGRRTYDIFAGYWPSHTEGDVGAIGRVFNAVPKYVASRSRPQLDWQNSTLLGDDLNAEVTALRARHRGIHVIGSVDLVHTLMSDGLYDELNLWMFPVVLGQGKKVFPDGVPAATLRLLEPPLTSGTGAVRLRYAPAGDVQVGSF